VALPTVGILPWFKLREPPFCSPVLFARFSDLDSFSFSALDRVCAGQIVLVDQDGRVWCLLMLSCLLACGSPLGGHLTRSPRSVVDQAPPRDGASLGDTNAQGERAKGVATAASSRDRRRTWLTTCYVQANHLARCLAPRLLHPTVKILLAASSEPPSYLFLTWSAKTPSQASIHR
jgi:hypothetical protein